jgi:hypothetical protein
MPYGPAHACLPRFHHIVTTLTLDCLVIMTLHHMVKTVTVEQIVTTIALEHIVTTLTLYRTITTVTCYNIDP